MTAKRYLQIDSTCRRNAYIILLCFTLISFPDISLSEDREKSATRISEGFGYRLGATAEELGLKESMRHRSISSVFPEAKSVILHDPSKKFPYKNLSFTPLTEKLIEIVGVKYYKMKAAMHPSDQVEKEFNEVRKIIELEHPMLKEVWPSQPETVRIVNFCEGEKWIFGGRVKTGIGNCIILRGGTVGEPVVYSLQLEYEDSIARDLYKAEEKEILKQKGKNIRDW